MIRSVPVNKFLSDLNEGWSTYWMKICIDVPVEWTGLPVTLLVDPSAEALIWSSNGTPLQGITGGNGDDRHIDYPLIDTCVGGERIDLYIEVACNGLFGCGDFLIGAPDKNRFIHYEQGLHENVQACKVGNCSAE
jgi:alpha-mannosidase